MKIPKKCRFFFGQAPLNTHSIAADSVTLALFEMLLPLLFCQLVEVISKWSSLNLSHSGPNLECQIL